MKYTTERYLVLWGLPVLVVVFFLAVIWTLGSGG